MDKAPIRVSMVEDSTAIRGVLEERIETESDMSFISGYEDAESAVDHLPEDNPDIVIMDIGLPGMNGIECMMRVKLKNPDINFLMFTVFEDSEKVFEALKAGALGYILKDDGIDGVVSGIRDLVNQGAPMSKEIARKVLSSFHTKRRLVEGLNAKEHELLELLSKGLLYKEIADQLQPKLTVGTVKQYVHRIYQKLQVNNRTEAINKYLNTK